MIDLLTKRYTSAARKEGIADFILIGQIAEIRTILVELDEVPDD